MTAPKPSLQQKPRTKSPRKHASSSPSDIFQLLPGTPRPAMPPPRSVSPSGEESRARNALYAVCVWTGPSFLISHNTWATRRDVLPVIAFYLLTCCQSVHPSSRPLFQPLPASSCPVRACLLHGVRPTQRRNAVVCSLVAPADTTNRTAETVMSPLAKLWI